MTTSNSYLSQIDTIVVLMLENRSLDNLLGWLYCDSKPNAVYPLGSSPKFDGVVGQTCQYKEGSFAPPKGTTNQKGWYPTRVPAYDPNEDFEDMVKQMFTDGHGRWNKVNPSSPFSSTPAMNGYMKNYNSWYVEQVGQVLGGFTAKELPVMYGLAEAFAVSDAWFASVPAQTNPNRAFSICGTSLGFVDNDEFTPKDFANTTTLFNVLSSQSQKSFGIYWQNNWLGAGREPYSWPTCYTVNMFPQIEQVAFPPGQAPSDGANYGEVDTYKKFLATVKSGGEIPSFCYLEPFWGGGKGSMFMDGVGFWWSGVQGNDYHPCADVGPAEFSLNELYQALVSHPKWSKMLFVILFDECGGTWDHVPPPATTPPSASAGLLARAYDFNFNHLGPRVPALLISPYIQRGTVFRAPSGNFDHTSLIATVLKWAGVDPQQAGLGERVKNAPTFEGVIQDTIVNPDPPQDFLAGSDYADYATRSGGVGTLRLDGQDAGKIDSVPGKFVMRLIDILGYLLPGMNPDKAAFASAAEKMAEEEKKKPEGTL